MASLLLVEDEPSIAGIVSFKLEREGHVLRWVDEAGRAEEAAGALGPDLLLFDLESGDEEQLSRLCARWRVLALTGSDDTTASDRALQAGAISTVRKPFKPTVLARVVRELTG
ncbi:MAG: response regulator [bacterium]|jgi:DNA-binding response OmpR family regulator|nr:response regulator [bacterium]